MPRLGGKNHYWLNGLYEALCVIVVFPLIVALGAGGKLSGNLFSKGCDFMGKISYPLYIVHYPVIYLYWNWVTPRHLPWTSVMAFYYFDCSVLCDDGLCLSEIV